MLWQITDVSFVSAYQISELWGYVSDTLLKKYHFFLKFKFCIPYVSFVQNSSHVSVENV